MDTLLHWNGKPYPIAEFMLGFLFGVLLCLLSGCAAHKPAIKPGHDLEHPALTPLGKGLCKTGFLKLFNSYGWHNCKNEEPKVVRPVPEDAGEGKMGGKP